MFAKARKRLQSPKREKDFNLVEPSKRNVESDLETPAIFGRSFLQKCCILSGVEIDHLRSFTEAYEKF